MFFRQLFKRVRYLEKQMGRLFVTQQELKAQLDKLTAQAVKVNGEIQALKDLIANRDDVPQDVVDSVAALGAAIQTGDDLNPDAPTP